MKPLIITPAPGEEVWSCGGFLAAFHNSLKSRVKACGGEIDIRDRARVMYGVIADHSHASRGYVSSQQQVDAVKLSAETLGYTWESMFWGRAYNGKLHTIPPVTLAKKILERINFYKPTDIFIETPVVTGRLVPSDVFVLHNIVLDVILRPELGHINLYGFRFHNKTGIFKPVSDRSYAYKLAATCAYFDLVRDTRRQKRNIDTIARRNGSLINTRRAEVFTPLRVKINNNIYYSLI